MFNEIKFSEYVDTGRLIDKINLPDFLKVYLNHRPPFGNTLAGIQNSFNVLGFTNSQGEKAIRREDFLNLLLTKGNIQARTSGGILEPFPAEKAPLKQEGMWGSPSVMMNCHVTGCHPPGSSRTVLCI